MENLQEWANRNEPGKEMLWKDAYWQQIMFVRDQLSGLLARNYDQYKNLVKVVGDHRSKSIICPVYHIDLGSAKFWLRYNYYNWNISVESESPLDCEFLDCFSDELYGYCYCEGMEQWKYGPYKENNQKFTVCINDKYDVYVFFRAVRKHLGITCETI